MKLCFIFEPRDFV